MTLLREANTIAVVGCSRHPEKAAHRIPAQLQAAGYRVIPVNPNASEILGEKAFDRVDQIDEPIDIVDVFRPPGDCTAVAEQAVEAGAGAVWLQLGIRCPEAQEIVESAGIPYVEDACTGALVSAHGITPGGSA